MAHKIQSHCELIVYQKAFAAAMDVYELSKSFPKEETYSLTGMIVHPETWVIGAERR